MRACIFRPKSQSVGARLTIKLWQKGFWPGIFCDHAPLVTTCDQVTRICDHTGHSFLGIGFLLLDSALIFFALQPPTRRAYGTQTCGLLTTDKHGAVLSKASSTRLSNSTFPGLEAYFAGGFGYDGPGGSRILLDTIDIFSLDTETWRTASESKHDFNTSSSDSVHST